MYYRYETDRLLGENFKQIERFRTRDNLNEVEGPPAEIPADRWSDIPTEAIRIFQPGDDDASPATDGLKNPQATNTEQSSRIERVFREVGVEAIACYKSRRYLNQKPFPGLWGVFYLKIGVEHLAYRLRDYYGVQNSLEIVYSLIRRHEFFHFKADIHTMLLELVSHQQLYTPTRLAFQRSPNQFVEEALANREVLTSVQRRSKAVREFAEDWMSVQPGAYSRYNEPHEELSAEWAANILDGNYIKSARRYDLAGWAGAIPTLFSPGKLCREYIVDAVITNRMFPPAFKMPIVLSVQDSADVQKRINKKYRQLSGQWEEQKQKLVENPSLPGLRFKHWPKEDPRWSVRVNKSFRAHLDPPTTSDGKWVTARFGPHKELGHG
jgi:hypothetical protein